MMSNWRPVPTWFWIALTVLVVFFVLPFLIFGAGSTS